MKRYRTPEYDDIGMQEDPNGDWVNLKETDLLPAVPIEELPRYTMLAVQYDSSTSGVSTERDDCGPWVAVDDLQSIAPTRACDCEARVLELETKWNAAEAHVDELIGNYERLEGRCKMKEDTISMVKQERDAIGRALSKQVADNAHLQSELAKLREQIAGKRSVVEPEPVPAVPKRIAYGDEWAKYEYRGYVIFDTCCGQAGCYVGHSYYGKTLQEACSKIDGLLAPLNEGEATE